MDGRNSFIGDGVFKGDGGQALQILWLYFMNINLCVVVERRSQCLKPLREKWKWKMIPNCPGRYVVKKNKQISSLSTDKLLLLTFGDEDVQSSWILEKTETSSNKCTDAIVVVVFKDGGGIITYCKPENIFVHTLNTTSGLQRKLEGLNLASLLRQ